jgi:hypothetical protein
VFFVSCLLFVCVPSVLCICIHVFARLFVSSAVCVSIVCILFQSLSNLIAGFVCCVDVVFCEIFFSLHVSLPMDASFIPVLFVLSVLL